MTFQNTWDKENTPFATDPIPAPSSSMLVPSILGRNDRISGSSSWLSCSAWESSIISCMVASWECCNQNAIISRRAESWIVNDNQKINVSICSRAIRLLTLLDVYVLFFNFNVNSSEILILHNCFNKCIFKIHLYKAWILFQEVQYSGWGRGHSRQHITYNHTLHLKFLNNPFHINHREIWIIENAVIYDTSITYSYLSYLYPWYRNTIWMFSIEWGLKKSIELKTK